MLTDCPPGKPAGQSVSAFMIQRQTQYEKF